MAAPARNSRGSDNLETDQVFVSRSYTSTVATSSPFGRVLDLLKCLPPANMIIFPVAATAKCVLETDNLEVDHDCVKLLKISTTSEVWKRFNEPSGYWPPEL